MQGGGAFVVYQLHRYSYRQAPSWAPAVSSGASAISDPCMGGVTAYGVTSNAPISQATRFIPMVS